MKKIFVTNHPVYLFEASESDRVQKIANVPASEIIRLKNQNLRSFLYLIEKIETAPDKKNFLLNDDSGKYLGKAFFSNFRLVIAAGGVVLNKEKKVLMIFRRGKWDLPKGKVESGEDISEAAVREVEEETGIAQIKLQDQIRFLNSEQDCTYHTYLEKGERIIKSTYWFRMELNSDVKLVPQREEGITEVRWVSNNEVQQLLINSYNSIADVIAESGL